MCLCFYARVIVIALWMTMTFLLDNDIVNFRLLVLRNINGVSEKDRIICSLFIVSHTKYEPFTMSRSIRTISQLIWSRNEHEHSNVHSSISN